MGAANRRPEALYRKLWWPRPRRYCCTRNRNGSSSPIACTPTPSTEYQWVAAGRGKKPLFRGGITLWMDGWMWYTHRRHFLGHKTIRLALQQLDGQANVSLVAFLCRKRREQRERADGRDKRVSRKWHKRVCTVGEKYIAYFSNLKILILT